MAKNDYSQYQKDVISGYYNNLDMIMLGKLGELVTEVVHPDEAVGPDIAVRAGHEGNHWITFSDLVLKVLIGTARYIGGV